VDKFFEVAKVGCYCEAITHSTEKRKDGETKVIQLSLRVDPFDAKLATAVDTTVRATLFKLGNAEPHDHLRRVSFALGTGRQLLTIFATPDSGRPSIALDQVRIGDVYARTSKDARGYMLVFKAIFGPPDATELEYCERWRNGMAFVTFEAAEPSELFELEGEEEGDDGEPEQPRLPAPEFESDEDGRPLEDQAAAADREPARRAKPQPFRGGRRGGKQMKPKARGRLRRR
jgi:hypothetical protein